MAGTNGPPVTDSQPPTPDHHNRPFFADFLTNDLRSLIKLSLHYYNYFLNMLSQENTDPRSPTTTTDHHNRSPLYQLKILRSVFQKCKLCWS